MMPHKTHHCYELACYLTPTNLFLKSASTMIFPKQNKKKVHSTKQYSNQLSKQFYHTKHSRNQKNKNKQETRVNIDTLTFVIDLAVAVDVGLPDHLVHFFVGEFLAQIGHDVAEFRCRDETVAVLVKHSECLANLLLAVCVLHFSGHHRQKFGEVDRSVA